MPMRPLVGLPARPRSDVGRDGMVDVEVVCAAVAITIAIAIAIAMVMALIGLL